MHTFSVSFLLLSTCTLLACCIAQGVPFNPSTQNIQQAFDGLLGSEDKLAQLGVTSIVISAVHDNKIIFSKGYGSVNPNSAAQKHVAPDPQLSQYSIASITKTFTTLCLLQQVEQQRFTLNSSVNDGLAEPIVKNEIIGNSIGDSYSGRPVTGTTDSVTMVNLLTHTGGFDEAFMGLSARSFSEKQPLKQYMEQHMPPRIRKPNIVSTYSNHALSLVGLVVENSAGKPFGTYLKDHILAPLNLTHTIYEYPEHGFQGNPYFPHPAVSTDHGKTFVELSKFGQYMHAAPAGAMWSTAEDMAKYMIVHLNYGVDPSSSNRIISEQMAHQMYREQFTMAPGLSGFGYIWWQLYADDIHYVEHGGSLPPYFSQLSLFHDSNAGLFMALVGSSNVALQILKNKFIAVTMKNESTYCTGPGQQYYASSGTCTQTVPLSSIRPVSTDYKDRFTKYQGCYKNFRYEHTTWLKFLTLLDEPICVAQFGNDSPVLNMLSSSTPNVVLWEVDRNLFRIGQLDKDGINVTFSVTKNSTLSFIMDESLDHAGYMAIDQIPFEYANTNMGWGAMFFAAFGLLCFMCCCCCCGCVIAWGVFDLRAYLNIYRNRAQNKETKSFDDAFGQISEEYNEEEEEGAHFAGLSHGSTVEKHNKQKRMSKILLALSIGLTLITVVGILWVTVLNVSHFPFVFFQLAIIQTTDSALFEQSSRSGLILALLLPVLSAIGISILIVSCIGAIVVRLLKRQQLGWIYTIVLGSAVIVCVTVNIFYLVTTGYFNIFGTSFLH